MTIRLHDWRRICRLNAHYMGTQLWVWSDYARKRTRVMGEG